MRSCEADADGICDDVDPCVGELDDAASATVPGDYDCGCSDIPEAIALRRQPARRPWRCGGPCEADADMDGICDDVDECVGELDDCGICNGPGAIYDCGCSDIPGRLDCDGNQLDALSAVVHVRPTPTWPAC